MIAPYDLRSWNSNTPCFASLQLTPRNSLSMRILAVLTHKRPHSLGLAGICAIACDICGLIQHPPRETNYTTKWK